MLNEDIMALMEHATNGQLAVPRADSEELTSREAIAALIIADAHLELAADRLHITPEQLVSLIASDLSAPQLLASQMRVWATIKMTATLAKVQRTLDSKIDMLDAYDLSKTYTTLLDKVLQATDNHESTQNINVQEVILTMLPPAAREALKQIIAEPPTVVENVPVDE